MRLCAFCPSPATKKGEHIFDDWLNRDEDGKFFNRKYEVESEGRYDHESRTYIASSVNITRPVVCSTCNNTWMSDLTNLAKSTAEGIIRHARPVTLLPLGITTLAAYTFMKAVVVDYSITLDNHRPFFKPLTRYKFQQTLTIPNGVQIWLGHHSQSGKLTSGHAWARTIRLYTAPVKGFDFYLFTYMVGHFAVQLTCPQWSKRADRRPNDLPVLNEAPSWQRYTVPLWPDVSVAYWPPPAEMDRVRLEEFRDRFRNLRALASRRT